MVDIGIIGTNFISDWFVEACRRGSGRLRPAAVLSRDPDRGQEFAHRNDVPRAFTDLADMIDAVDAVYVASPTSAHHGQAMAAIEAGRHVLIEKTMTSSATQAEEIFAAASARGVVAMEAARHVHTPAFRAFVQAIGELGTLRYAHVEMLQYSSRYGRFLAGEHVNAFDPTLGNSALIDIGFYPLTAALACFGTAPRAQTGGSFLLDNGFEAGGGIQLDYDGLLVDVAYSKIVAGVGPCTVHGEEGTVTINSVAEPSRIVRYRRGAEPEFLLDEPAVTPVDTMVHELDVFADQVDSGAVDPRWRDLSLAVRRTMDIHLDRQ
ncbi:MAG: Gfo/Idh/MocA family oxidoreductase [Tessaracoccus sp.]|uniref:Gfo/Idh/MocA family protein n=1 Tax=Tessaracoccus sp. TaxID=1971211 RepID=UPI001EB51A76|nr:Gfo/Idh/MocA family oxidoreductase [Tessaracoccus sp.]MBK7821929.1 Gfo/Idh/MocA family oxidoreductase [Tessaracoccus sp.]